MSPEELDAARRLGVCLHHPGEFGTVVGNSYRALVEHIDEQAELIAILKEAL
jgi:hypothetical protein